MRLNIVPFMPEHLLRMDVQEAQRLNFSVADGAEMAGYGYAKSAVDGDKVIACMAIAELAQHRAIVFALLSADAGRYMLDFTRFALREFATLPYARLESLVACDFAAGHRWMKMLGFEIEAPRMKKFSTRLQDYSLYARVTT